MYVYKITILITNAANEHFVIKFPNITIGNTTKYMSWGVNETIM